MKKGQMIMFDNARFCRLGKESVQHDEFKLGTVKEVFENGKIQVECLRLNYFGDVIGKNTYEIEASEITDTNPDPNDYWVCV